MSPNNTEVLQLIAQAYINLDQLDEAKTKLEALLERVPNVIPALDLLEQVKSRFNLNGGL